MAMPPYTIHCQACGAKASLKVASHWSDGETRELKTYSIVCDRCLDAALKILKPEGRLVVVSFHSLEDRIVKQFLGSRSTSAPRASRHAPDVVADKPAFQLLNKGAQTPSVDEIQSNPRARSAKLRAGIKLAA